MADLLRQLPYGVFFNQGYLFEGDVYSVLRHSPYVLRGFEFSLADGGIDCTRRYSDECNYLRRLWDANDRERYPPDASEIALFEVKSTTAAASGDEPFLTTTAQRRRVAFWICVTAADARYVELIPNYWQESAALDETSTRGEEEANRAVSSTRVCRLPPRTYGMLDQCGSPYRMPIALLPQAIERVRLHIRTRGATPYVNPGNDLAFPEWQPVTINTCRWLRPSEESGSAYSAYNFTMQFFQALTFAAPEYGLSMDLVGLQPRLADIKVLLPQEGGGIRQCLVQLKGDGRFRALATGLDKVFIARAEGKNTRYYFTAFERFDFLLMYFDFSQLPNPTPRREFFLLPESAIPDEFYTTTALEASFERAEFREFRVHMDSGGQWVSRVREILERFPSPQKAGERPLRHYDLRLAVEEGAGEGQEGAGGEAGGAERFSQRVGRHHYKVVMEHRHRTFFYHIMELCARTMSGLLVVLATNHPFGDYAYCRYEWTPAERDDYLRAADGRPPLVAHELVPDTPVVAASYYVRSTETSFAGINVSPSVFRRINSCPHPRLLIWDFGAYDTMIRPLNPAVIPSEDVQPSEKQRAAFQANIGAKRTQGLPNISGLLASGLYASEYAIGNGGPLVYEEPDWLATKRLLDEFVSADTLQHPPGRVRNAARYRTTMRDLHRRLADEHQLAGFGLSTAGEDVDAMEEDA